MPDQGKHSQPRYRLEDRFASSGAKLMSKRDPVASAKRSSVRMDGRVRPLSSRAMTGCVVPIFRASSSCGSLTCLQQRLVKTGGRLVKHARYYWLLLAESHLTRQLFATMLRRIWAISVWTG